MENVLKRYKHRYRNIFIRNHSKDQLLHVPIGDYEFYIDIVGEKVIVFKDNEDSLYHMSVSTDTLDVLTEIFIDSTDIDNPKILVVENDTSNQAMIVSKAGVKKFNVDTIRDDNGDVVNYNSENFSITNTGIIIPD